MRKSGRRPKPTSIRSVPKPGRSATVCRHGLTDSNDPPHLAQRNRRASPSSVSPNESHRSSLAVVFAAAVQSGSSVTCRDVAVHGGVTKRSAIRPVILRLALVDMQAFFNVLSRRYLQLVNRFVSFGEGGELIAKSKTTVASRSHGSTLRVRFHLTEVRASVRP